ncbi:hypothetical protein [Streptomyces sp. SID9727]|uniref:hypothetical protein n=1 Tax=Streptomyces sp. SID9727 TaxID=2706114 RepID=UPI0013C88DC0|nr:hypothetical protein [Streptomyces sp. SID9727]NEC65536.1 hypothetical protein [Streptomyces sp. SID9727]
MTVTGWDAQTWERTTSRTFSVPVDAVVKDFYPSDGPIIGSPLTDLCSDPPDDAPRAIPDSPLRQLFDEGYTRMAVVLLDPETEATRVGYVDVNGKVTQLSRTADDDFGNAPHEEQAVFARDGGAVWFTELDLSTDAVRISSRSVSGDHARVEHGSGEEGSMGSLALADDPVRGVFGRNVWVSPGGHKALARIDGDSVVDLPQDSVLLSTLPDNRLHYYASDCFGWLDEVRVLCGSGGILDDLSTAPERRNSFWTLDTSDLTGKEEVPDSAMGKPIIPANDRKNTVQAISSDGKQMIFASLQGNRLTHYRSSTAPGSNPKEISEPGVEEALSDGYVLEWR